MDTLSKKSFVFRLDRVYYRVIKEITVLYKDRSCRFGFQLLESICRKAACRIVLHNEANLNEQYVIQGLCESLLSAIIVFFY